MKTLVQKRKREAGQATALVVLAMSIFLLGAAGLAVDGSHLYAQRQMAQTAADAAAQAGILSIFDGSNATGTHAFSTNKGFTCATSDARTPCYYAQTMNGFNASTDTVTVDFPSASTVGVPSGILSSTDSPNLLRVTIQRQVSTTLMAMLGPTASTISASGTAAIVAIVSPTPIVITHPTLAGALNMNGHTSITITGGPQRSIQINSSNAAAYSGPSSGSVDLSKAGPKGTGGDFGVFGGPTTNPGDVSLGSTGHYISPASPIQDPLAGIAAPSQPTTTPPPQGGQSCTVLKHCSSCPGGASTCTEYLPGLYSSGINIMNNTAMFDPGIYYVQSGGFSTKNSTVGMCTSCAADPTTLNGMLVYDTGPASKGCDASGGFTIDTNSNDIFYGAGVSAANLTAAPASPYYGILFFEDRSACAQTHTIGQGNGCFTAYGTVYITNTLAIMTSKPAQYQTVDYHGTPCSNTQNYGEFIVSSMSFQGTASLNMGLFPTGFLTVRQVALVN